MGPTWIQVGKKRGLPIAACDVCNVAKHVPTEAVLADFIFAHADHYSTADGWLGAGDIIHAAAERLGIDGCTPCEKRRRAMNQALPRVFRKS